MRLNALFLTVALALIPTASVWSQHKSPGVVRLAIGPIESLPKELRRAFTLNDDFKPLPKPGADDWLSVHEEPGQTYRQFIASDPNTPTATRNVIYIQPLDSFAGRDPEDLVLLRRLAEAYFQSPVTLQDPIDVTRAAIAERKNPMTKQRQLHSPDILTFLEKELPDDSFCRLGITTIDLYPEPTWNFVFGEASLSGSTGVYSFARYDPSSYGEKPTPGDRALALLRSFKVLAHETGHMYGIEHCVYLLCVMNGSNNLEETDLSPVHLCPLCLRKLHHSLGFDMAKRYRDLAALYVHAGMADETAWVKKRATYISKP